MYPFLMLKEGRGEFRGCVSGRAFRRRQGNKVMRNCRDLVRGGHVLIDENFQTRWMSVVVFAALR